MGGYERKPEPASYRRHAKVVRPRLRVGRFLFAGLGVALGSLAVLSADRAPDDASGARLDPAGWGDDHVGRPVPEFVAGDECLFCHRHDIGANWATNRHQTTLRAAATEPKALHALRKHPALRAFADDVQLVMGRAHRIRFLKRSRAYGQLDLLSAEWASPREGKTGAFLHADAAQWDEKTFGASCAGCHTTGVDGETYAFSALALDCYACHGDATLNHSKDTTRMVLARKRNDPPEVVISICGQCHLRGGRSRSTGLLYPNNFVAGDNLFRDFEVDLTDAQLARSDPADRHILENVRDVVLEGRRDVTCLSCHDIHRQSSRKHRHVGADGHCATCHAHERNGVVPRPLDVHGEVCGY